MSIGQALVEAYSASWIQIRRIPQIHRCERPWSSEPPPLPDYDAGMTGMELIEEVRKRNESIPIILCTGYCKTLDEATALAAGANEFCPKPLSMSELGQIIRKHLDD